MFNAMNRENLINASIYLENKLDEAHVEKVALKKEFRTYQIKDPEAKGLPFTTAEFRYVVEKLIEEGKIKIFGGGSVITNFIGTRIYRP